LTHGLAFGLETDLVAACLLVDGATAATGSTSSTTGSSLQICRNQSHFRVKLPLFFFFLVQLFQIRSHLRVSTII